MGETGYKLGMELLIHSDFIHIYTVYQTNMGSCLGPSTDQLSDLEQVIWLLRISFFICHTGAWHGLVVRTCELTHMKCPYKYPMAMITVSSDTQSYMVGQSFVFLVLAGRFHLTQEELILNFRKSSLLNQEESVEIARIKTELGRRWREREEGVSDGPRKAPWLRFPSCLLLSTLDRGATHMHSAHCENSLILLWGPPSADCK